VRRPEPTPQGIERGKSGLAGKRPSASTDPDEALAALWQSADESSCKETHAERAGGVAAEPGKVPAVVIPPTAAEILASLGGSSSPAPERKKKPNLGVAKAAVDKLVEKGPSVKKSTAAAAPAARVSSDARSKIQSKSRSRGKGEVKL